jgi:hypothetical protein
MQTDRKPLPEEYVTFQVALIGSDGLVVASDRRANNLTPVADENPGVMMNEQDKFRLNKVGTVLCFYAGGADCETQAREIVLNCQPSEDEVKWETGLCEAARQNRRVAGGELLNEFLVIRQDIKNALWVIKSLSFDSYVTKLTDRTCTGNNALAKFLVVHLWKRNRPVIELKQLALLTLAYAEKENPSTVGGGFDVMVMRGLQFEWSRHDFPDEIFAQFDGKLRAAFDELR